MEDNIQLSLVLPFYNEEEAVESVLLDLLNSFDKTNISYEIIAVNNGSSDNTSNLISKLSKSRSKIKLVTVPVNKGYGHGIICGLKETKGLVIGFVDGDGQVSSEDVVRCANYILSNPSVNYCKFRRNTREDGYIRKVYSNIFNKIMRLFFGLKVKDMNAKPKLFSRELYNKMLPLVSKDWFIDAETLVKAKNNNVKIIEIPGRFKEREKGQSNVRTSTIWEFVKNILGAKLRGFK